MTNEEALAILEDGILSGKTDTPENNEALDLAIMALKKQIPKKMTITLIPRTCAGKLFPLKCPNPNCDCRFMETTDYDHCPVCGQAIDWRDITGE